MSDRRHTISWLSTFFLFLLISTTAVCSTVQVTIFVTVPPTTPENENICITGDHGLLSNWSGKGITLKEKGPNLFSFTGEFPKNSAIEFKFTRGTFDSVEKASDGKEIRNRKLSISGDRPLTMTCKVEAWADQFQHGNSTNKPMITGDYEILEKVTSAFLSPPRNIIVWLPPSYKMRKHRSKRYPVIYMHDGQNLFDPTTSFGGVDWGVDEAMTEGIKNRQFKEAIIVAISNTADRMSEYTPFPDAKHKGGDGKNYVRFVVEELKPLIDDRFRTIKSREHTFIGGSSLGGLISLYAGISHPNVFGGIIAMSPSVWWSDRKIISWLIDNNVEDYNGRIWLDMGTREGKEALDNTRRLANTLAQKAPGFKGLHYREFSGGTHSESAWKNRIHLPLKFFLK